MSYGNNSKPSSMVYPFLLTLNVSNKKNLVAASAWFKCDNCQHGIHTQRYSCQYCETDEEGMNSFDLCVSCFQVNFPYSHPHPRESFALEVIEEDLDLNTDDHEEPNAAATIKGRSLQPDTFLPNWESLKPPQNEFEMLLEERWCEHGSNNYLIASNRREHYCELCDEGDGDAFGPFVSDIPFAVPGTRSGVPQSYFWIHRGNAYNFILFFSLEMRHLPLPAQQPVHSQPRKSCAAKTTGSTLQRPSVEANGS